MVLVAAGELVWKRASVFVRSSAPTKVGRGRIGFPMGHACMGYHRGGRLDASFAGVNRRAPRPCPLNPPLPDERES